MRTPKLQIAADQPLTGECWIPPKKDTHHPRAKEKPQQDCRRGEIMFAIKPHTHQSLEGSNKTLCARGSRDPTEMEPDLCLSLLQRSRSAVACCRGRDSGCSYLGHAACSISPLRGGHSSSINPTTEHLSRRPTNCRTIIQRNSPVVKKVLRPTTDFSTWGSGKGTENPQGIWLWRPVGFDYRTSTGLGRDSRRAQTKRCAHQSCPSTKNWIKNLLGMTSLIRIRPSFPQSVSPIRKLP